MFGYLLLIIFGWHRVPERFVTRGMDFITLFLKDLGIKDAQQLSPACLRALAQLAYRRAGKEQNEQPRFFFYVRELKRVSRSVHAVVTGCGPADGEIRSLLLWHGVDCFSSEPKVSRLTTMAVTPVADAPAASTSNSTDSHRYPQAPQRRSSAPFLSKLTHNARFVKLMNRLMPK